MASTVLHHRDRVSRPGRAARRAPSSESRSHRLGRDLRSYAVMLVLGLIAVPGLLLYWLLELLGLDLSGHRDIAA